MGRNLVLYGRPGCHLCDDARLMLEPVASSLDLDWTEFNIECDDELHKRYLERIPVLADGDDVIAELIWDQAELRGRLEALASSN